MQVSNYNEDTNKHSSLAICAAAAVFEGKNGKTNRKTDTTVEA